MLGFDIDQRQVVAIADEFAASNKQVEMAYKRALTRTAATLRKIASAGLKSELGLRNTTALRRRIKEYRIRRAGAGGVKLWFGANDLPLSAFKGRARAVPGGVKFGETMIHGAFFAKRGGRRGVYRRLTDAAYPIDEARLPVADRIMVFVEDNVFVDLEAIFFKHFGDDIRRRTIYKVGDRA